MTTCPECNDTGERDSGGTHPWGEPVYLPCDCKDAEIGRRWRENSSLEKWFPLTAERQAVLEQWARDCRDQVLYPAAQREDAIGRAADCLGQALVELLREAGDDYTVEWGSGELYDDAAAELERLRTENAALKRDLQYARDGLTKGRSRMREDNERLTALLRQALDALEAESAWGGPTPKGAAAIASLRRALGPNARANLTDTAR